MKHLTTKLMIAFAAVIMTAPAHADLLLEPYLGYHTGKSKQTSGIDTDTKGVSYGARIGYQTLGFMVGVDYMTGMWQDSGSPKSDLTPSDLGVFVGYNFPIMLRVYGVLAPEALNPSLKAKNSGGTNKYEGSSMKLGVGFTALPFVSINLEIIKATYTEVNGNKMSNNLNNDMFGLTVSLPLTF